MKALLSLNHYFLRYKFYLLLGIAFVVLSNLFAIYPAQMVRSSFDLVAGQIENISGISDSSSKEAALQNLKNEVLWYGFLIVAMALVRGLFLFFMRQTIIVMSRHIEFDQKNDIYLKYQSLPLRFYRQHNTGDLMARISEDVGRVRMYTGPAIMYGINMLVLFVMVIGYMLSVSVEFTVYVLLPLPVLSLAVYFINSEVQQRSDKIQQSLSGLATFVQESFSGIRVIKAFGREEDAVSKFDAESQQYRDRSIHLGNLNAWFSPVIISLIGLSSIITVFAGGQQVMQGKITTGNIAEFLIYVNMLTWPVTSLGWVISMAQRAAVSQKRINEFLQEASVIQSSENISMPVKGSLEFRNVSLRYPETGIQALQNISFRVNAGDSIGILGGTGSGKSTLANLVCRLYDPDEGEILLDGHPLRSWNLHTLRRQTGYVPQDVFLFSDSIRNNIFFGEDEQNQVAMDKAARQADLTENVQRFEKQFETIIGERGITLSGGQKQRLSLARALVKNPRILVLDDCLSAVDTSTEKTILAHLKEEMKGRTTLIISHRISSVNMADTILVMEDGKIVQQGRHEELVSVSGPYRSLFEKQLLTEEV